MNQRRLKLLKRNTFFLIGLVPLIFITVCTCKKAPIKYEAPINYRNKFTGEFHFIKKETPWTYNKGTGQTSVIEYNGSVQYIYETGKENRKKIDIMSEPGKFRTYFLEKDGSISLDCGDYGGRFVDKDRLELEQIYCRSGLGGGVYTSLVGSRIK